MLTFLILLLAAYEVTDWLVYQSGPYEIFEKIRNYFGLYDAGIDDNKKYLFSNVLNRNDYNLMANILSCPYCTKVWVVLFLSLLAVVNITLLLPLAAMGGITIILDFRK